MSNVRYCGRTFTAAELQTIRELTAQPERYPSRAALSRAVCDALGWYKPDGLRKEMSCRVALLRMQRDGLLTLPPPATPPPPRHRAPSTPFSLSQEPVQGSRGQLLDLHLQPLRSRRDSRLWNDLVDRFHYLGYQPLPGAQIRYFIYDGDRLLGALGFGAAAWKVACRDQWIGWTPEQRQARLHLIANNARFLLLPWVSVRFLASAALALAARRLAPDWLARYGYQPVLLETFVERPRYVGTCYRAANWTCVGQTQGRGKLDRHHHHDQPVSRVGPGVAAGAPPSHRTCRSPAYGAPMPFHRCAVAGVA